MYNKILSGLLVVLLVAIIGALGYLGYEYFSKYSKEKEAEKYIQDEFESIIVPVSEQKNENEDKNEKEEKNNNNNNKNNNAPRNVANSGLYKGYKVAGKLEMPTINKQFPILDESENANAIEVSVVKVYGPELNTPGNVIIGGHNYNNGTFFSRNKNLKIGDKIYITDVTGKRVEYTIFSKYYAPESDSTWFNRQSNGKTEVTLYTCDATGKNRLIVCARAD